MVSNIRVGDTESRSKDVLGRVYEYFLSQFASAEGKKGGEFYTPRCVVRLLVEMLEPYKGRVYDPCCGSSGMFVQSEEFIAAHGGKLGDISIYGQESNYTTWRLARMNLAIRGIDGQIAHGDTFHNDKHPDLKADFILANPHFNDSDWRGALLREDKRWQYGVPPTGNANFAWVQHIIHHLAPMGLTGFVLANGSMSSNQSGEGEVRKNIVEADLVDCMIALPGQLFYSTQIPACLWFLARDKKNTRFRDRRGEVLFIDARKLAVIEIRWPPLPEQRAIAHILGTLDDKIELNRRMNETLEAMARAIFKSWFVDFDAVHARAEGRDPGLPKHIADLFPGCFEDSELGNIPEGWEVWRVSRVGNVVCGKTPSTAVSEYYGHDVPFITIPDMHGRIFATTTQKKLSRAGTVSQQNKMLPVGAICVSCIATPGLVVITSEESQTNQQINTVIPNESAATYFWFWIFRDLGNDIKAGGSGGSVLSNLSTGRFAELRVLGPTARLRHYYHPLVAPLFDRVLANEREIHTLTALRDTLLPKLISGEVRVMGQERVLDTSSS